MNGAETIAEILKREGTEFLSCYPRNPIIEPCAALDIRPILCRQERVGVGIADGYSRIKRGKRNGVFAAQAGPGIENAFPGIAQAYSENVPLLVVAGGMALDRQYFHPVFRAAEVMRPVTKWSALAHSAQELARSDAARLSGHAQRQTRPGSDRSAGRSLYRRIQGRARLRAGAGAARRARSRGHQGGRGAFARRQASAAMGRTGRALRRGLRAAGGARRTHSGAGGCHQSRQERHPRQPSARARRGDPFALETVRRFLAERRSRPRDRLEPHPHEFRAGRAAGQDHYSFQQRRRRHQQGVSRRLTRWSAMPRWSSTR